MRQVQFDQLAQGLATGLLSRRQVLKSFAAGTFLGFTGILSPWQTSTAAATQTCVGSAYEPCFEKKISMANDVAENCKEMEERTCDQDPAGFRCKAMLGSCEMMWWTMYYLAHRDCTKLMGCPQGTWCDNDVCCPAGTTGCGISSPGSCCGPCSSCVDGTCKWTALPDEMECCGQCMPYKEPSENPNCPSGAEIVCRDCAPVCRCPEGHTECGGAGGGGGGACCKPEQECKQGVCVDKNCGPNGVACPPDKPDCCNGRCIESCSGTLDANCECHCKPQREPCLTTDECCGNCCGILDKDGNPNGAVGLCCEGHCVHNPPCCFLGHPDFCW